MKSSATRKQTPYILVLMAIAVVAVAIGIKHVHEAPAFIHAWAQADRYALAVGFTDNGHDLFHPQTMVYNKQFPHKWREDDGSTVTAVDFPLHEYIIGWLMTLFGTKAPWVFRGFTLLVSIVGLWFLFLLACRLTGDWLKGLLVALVAMTSPLYAYYFANYLPSAPALALSMAGLWAYGQYYSSEFGVRSSELSGCGSNNSALRTPHSALSWHLAVGLVALATMIRTSQAVLLVALCAFETLRVLRRETTLWNKLPSVAVAAVAIAGYMLWNGHLRHEYGSVFLNELMPPRHWEDVHNVFDEMHWHWRFEYFSRLQHWLVAVACVVAVVLLIWKRVAGGRISGVTATESPSTRRLSLGWLAAIWWVGEVCFFVAMMRQFKNHDYYFLDCFFLPVLFTFILALRALPSFVGTATARTVGTQRAVSAGDEKRQSATARIVVTLLLLVGVVLLGGMMYNEAKHKVADRCWEGDLAYRTSQHYRDADLWLDAQGVPRDAKILAFLAYPQNGPLLQMGRKGYTVMDYDEAVVNAVLRFPYDYVVVEDERKEEAAEILERWELVADNGTLSLYNNSSFGSDKQVKMQCPFGGLTRLASRFNGWNWMGLYHLRAFRYAIFPSLFLRTYGTHDMVCPALTSH